MNQCALHYNKAGGYLELYWESVACYGLCLNDQITLMKAFDDHRVVGVKIYKNESFI